MYGARGGRHRRTGGQPSHTALPLPVACKARPCRDARLSVRFALFAPRPRGSQARLPGSHPRSGSGEVVEAPRGAPPCPKPPACSRVGFARALRLAFRGRESRERKTNRTPSVAFCRRRIRGQRGSTEGALLRAAGAGTTELGEGKDRDAQWRGAPRRHRGASGVKNGRDKRAKRGGSQAPVRGRSYGWAPLRLRSLRSQRPSERRRRHFGAHRIRRTADLASLGALDRAGDDGALSERTTSSGRRSCLCAAFRVKRASCRLGSRRCRRSALPGSGFCGVEFGKRRAVSRAPEPPGVRGSTQRRDG